MNTQEQLVVFVPALWAFSTMFERLGWPGFELAAALGVVWLVGRALYSREYLSDPATRRPGFALTIIPTTVMLAGAIVAILVAVAG
jgi:hypothetical protein